MEQRGLVAHLRVLNLNQLEELLKSIVDSLLVFDHEFLVLLELNYEIPLKEHFKLVIALYMINNLRNQVINPLE